MYYVLTYNVLRFNFLSFYIVLHYNISHTTCQAKTSFYNVLRFKMEQNDIFSSYKLYFRAKSLKLL